MSRYLLDTCIVSEFVRGHPAVKKAMIGTHPDKLSVSSITCMEIEYGLQLHDNQKLKHISEMITTFLDTIEILPYSVEDARVTATIRAQLKRIGQPIGAYDILLAGVAMHRGLIIVTHNMREFSRIQGLHTEDWCIS